MNHPKKELRQKALEAIAQNKSLVIVMRSPSSIEVCDRATFDTVFANDDNIESATWDDIYDCPHCGADVLIFEDACPNCGKVPWPEEFEMPEQSKSIHLFHLDSLPS